MIKSLICALLLPLLSPGPVELPEDSDETLKGLVFVAHLNLVADVPFRYGWLTYEAALGEGLDPLDLATILISEKSGPDYDFSVEASLKRNSFKWDTRAKGRDGEIGLFQTTNFWRKHHNRKRGTNWTSEEAYDPAINAKLAAYELATNYESHEKCKSEKWTYHITVAHYKCAPKSRDIAGQCRFAQKKWLKIRHSLGFYESPDLRVAVKPFKELLEKNRKKAERYTKKMMGQNP